MSGYGRMDLRMNRGGGQSEDSFWPSFTDIMTVVVLIFLLAMVVLLIKNMDLVDRLKATVEAERAAAELARATAQEKDSLATLLGEQEEEAAHLRLQLMRMQEQLHAARDATLAREAELAAAQREGEALRHRIGGLEQGLASTSQAYEAAAQDLARLRAEHGVLQARYQSARDEAQALAAARERQADALQASRAQAEQVGRQLAAMQGEYDELRVKYDRLVRPARTARGKEVVQVRYEKRDGANRIQLREPTDDAFRQVDERELHRALAALSERHADTLYVRVIFPEDSGLSYNEAWRFTNELLTRYDYYHRQ